MIVAVLLAHGGGWDETAFVGLPVALFGGLLAVANRRAQAEERRQAERDQPEPDGSVDPDDDRPRAG